MTDPIYPGNVVTVRTNDPAVAGSGFKNSAGVLADPTVVTLRWRRHQEAETVWLVTAGQVVRDSTGVYHADILVTEPGLHYYRWEGTGAVAAAAEGSFSVESTFIAGVP